LAGWWDADRDGVFANNERIITDLFNPRQGTPGPQGHPAWTQNFESYSYPIDLPGVKFEPQSVGDFFRFRLSYGNSPTNWSSPTGMVDFGEVEDHMTIPEPVSLALLGFGIAALAQRRRKKK
jgi:hypothetical protein